MRISSIWMLALLLGLVIGIASCAESWKNRPHDRWHQRSQAPILHPYPGRGSLPSEWWNGVHQSTVIPLAKLVSPARYLDKITDGRPALDINAFGQVPDSAWFVNRIGTHPFTVADIRRGPNLLGGPAVGELTVISDKTVGISPGLVLRDTAGVVWFAKFDSPAFSGLSTKAEWIASRLLYAAGYHVSETYLVDLDVKRLQLSSAAKRRNKYNRLVPMRDKHLVQLIALLNPDTKGQLRAVFSRAVPGRPLGSFSFRGLRPHDPNDRIPHERRRSLRGLWLFSAWLNNTDTGSQNTIDTFIPDTKDPTRGHIRHYLIDFGDSLGAARSRQKNTKEGHAHVVDWSEMTKSLFSFGLYYPYWYPLRRTPFREVGLFEAAFFVPSRWRPSQQNLAFEEATSRDTFWAATILSRFTRKHIASVVADAGYREPEAAKWIVDVLMKRRAKLLRYSVRHLLPLTDFRADEFTVHFNDFQPPPSAVGYRWTLRWNRYGRDSLLGKGVATCPTIELGAVFTALASKRRKQMLQEPFVTLSIWSAAKERGARVEAHFRIVSSGLLPVGLWREVR